MSLFFALILLLFSGEALAHNVTVFAWVEGDTIHVESKYSGGRRPMAAPVEVYDSRGILLLKGATDDNGEFSFNVPAKTEMKVVVLAGMGHRGEWTIPVADLEGVSVNLPAQAAPAASPPGAETGADQARNGPPPASGDPVAGGGLTATQIQHAVEHALDAKLKPVLTLLVETRQRRPSVTDVLGGIGYIFGLIGVAAFISAKRRNPQ
ncbi:MAG: hypothetical protein WAM61_01855 [Desulfobacterales bacterium]